MPSPSDSDEDDYLTMALPSTTPPLNPTTSLSRARAAKRAAELAAQPRSKRAAEHDRLLRLERGLGTSALQRPTDPAEGASKGARLMAKLGYTGGALGKKQGADDGGGAEVGERDAHGRLLAPLRVQIKAGRGGVGHGEVGDDGVEGLAAGVKRAREEVARDEERMKRLKAQTGAYREREGSEREEARREGLWRGAMRVGRTLWEGREGRELKAGEVGKWPEVMRPLGVEEGEKEEERRAERRRRDFMGRMAAEGEEDDDEDDRVARGETPEEMLGFGGEVEEEDAEAREYAALPAGDKLEKVLLWLRKEFWYCFWCKSRFDDESMEGCPGVGEEEHE